MHEGAAALQYGGSDGRLETRELVADLMAEIGVRLKPSDLLITAGAQQGLDLLAKTFLEPGDVVITEGPTYVGALQAFSAYQPDIRCVPMDDDGMRMDLLEDELKRLGPRGAKFIYTIPNFQNPGGVTMSPERRRRLLELAREYDIPVVEDDPYGRLRFEGGHMKPLRSLDDEVIYLGTFSKIFAPGLRLGWIAAPKPILAKVLLVKQAADLCGSQLRAGHRRALLPGHALAPHARRAHAHLRRAPRRDARRARRALPARGALDAAGGRLLRVGRAARPTSTASTMLAEAVERGVTFVPGDGFFPDGRGKNCMRLAFCYAAAGGHRRGHPAARRGRRRPARALPRVHRGGRAAGPERRGGMREKIAVLMGGRSLEREVSLASGRRVCEALDAARLLRAAARRDRRPRRDAAKRAPGRRLHRAARQVRRGRHDPGAARVPRHPVHRSRRRVVCAVVGQVGHQAPLRREGHPDARRGSRSPPTRSRRWARRPRSTSWARRSGGFPVAVKPARQGSALGLTRVDRPRRLADALLDALVVRHRGDRREVGRGRRARGLGARRGRRRARCCPRSRSCRRERALRLLGAHTPGDDRLLRARARRARGRRGRVRVSPREVHTRSAAAT